MIWLFLLWVGIGAPLGLFLGRLLSLSGAAYEDDEARR